MLLSPQGGGGNDAIVIVDKAPYPNKGEAGMAGAEATREDEEGGALLVPTMMMTTATMGVDKDEDMDANAVAMTMMMTTAMTNKDAPLPVRGGGVR
jgi:hypothetical protein